MHMHPKIKDDKNEQKKSAKPIKKIGARQCRSVDRGRKDKIERGRVVIYRYWRRPSLVLLRGTYSPVSGVVISWMYSELDTCYFIALRMPPQVLFYCFDMHFASFISSLPHA